jgi:hypothetical protein
MPILLKRLHQKNSVASDIANMLFIHNDAVILLMLPVPHGSLSHTIQMQICASVFLLDSHAHAVASDAFSCEYDVSRRILAHQTLLTVHLFALTICSSAGNNEQG